MQRLMPSSQCLESSEKQDIHECKSIQDVSKYFAKKHTLFVFDLDNTVISPIDVDDLGSDQWFAKLIDEAHRMISDPSEAMRVAVTIRNAVHQNITMQAVEPDVISIIHFLQSNDIPVLALTARGPSIIDTTEKQLKNVGIDFSKNWEKLEKLSEFKNGIIYCDGTDKGIVLAKCLKQLNVIFHDIVMADDSEKNLIRTQKAMTQLEIGFTGLRYGYLDNRVSQFNMEKAQAQLLKLKSYFSEDEKEMLRKLNKSITQFSLHRPVKKASIPEVSFQPRLEIH